MVSLADLMEWDLTTLDGVLDEDIADRRTLTQLQDEVDDAAVPASWRGDAANEAAKRHIELREDLADVIAELSLIAESIRIEHGALKRAQQEAQFAIDHARANEFSVRLSDGMVMDHALGPFEPHELEDRYRILDEIIERLNGALRSAGDADADLAAALDKVRSGVVDGGSGSFHDASNRGKGLADDAVLAPPKGGSANEMSSWWEGLSPQEQDQVIADNPDWIRNVDGIPATARDEANREVLPDLLDDARREVEEAEAAFLESAGSGGDYSYDRTEQAAAGAALAAARERLADLEAVQDTLDLPGQRQLLLLDTTSGVQMRAAIAHGNVDTADHVSVFTPGFTTTVRDGLAGYDEDMKDLKRESERSAQMYGDGGSVATIAWLGYDAPQWDGVVSFDGSSVASTARAQEGGAMLAGFVNGIDSSRQSDPHLTALGHSYGSTTMSFALRESTGIDSAVIFGSPGLATDDVGDFDLPPGELFRLEAKNDAVADLGTNGPLGMDPTWVNGIEGLSTHQTEIDGATHSEVTGHSDYLNQDSTSQHNIGVIVSGSDRDRLVHDDGRGLGDILTFPIRMPWD